MIDTGVGIDEVDLLKISEIFKDPFMEDKTSNSAGLGIGLRLSHGILKKLTNSEHFIELSSEKGVGTTIAF